MRSGHGAAGAVCRCVVMAVICHTFTARAHAQAAQVVGVDPRNSELVTRITGQTRDLPMRLRWINSASHAPARESELRAIAEKYAADVVVALRAMSGGHTVYVYASKPRTLRTREVPKPARSERFSSSAAAEAVALIVRSELSAALTSLQEAAEPSPDASAPDTSVSTGPGGTPNTTNEPKPLDLPPKPPEPPPPPPKVEPDPRPDDDDEQSEEDERADDPSQPSAAEVLAAWFAPPLRVSLALNMRGSVPIKDQPMGGPTAQLQLKLAHIGIALHASTSFSSDLHFPTAEISLRRHALQLELFAWLFTSANVEFALGPAVGMVFYQRTTKSGPWENTPGRTSESPTVSALAELRWHATHRVGLSVRAGLDFVLRPPRFTYQADPEKTPETTLARVSLYEPWIAAGLFVDIAD